MNFMFSKASSFNQPLDTNGNKWNVSAVNFMEMMFKGASAFNQPLSHWDVSNVTTMVSMFETASAFDQDLSMWQLRQGVNTNKMFLGSAMERNLQQYPPAAAAQAQAAQAQAANVANASQARTQAAQAQAAEAANIIEESIRQMGLPPLDEECDGQKDFKTKKTIGVGKGIKIKDDNGEHCYNIDSLVDMYISKLTQHDKKFKADTRNYSPMKTHYSHSELAKIILYAINA
jgi:surface protein